MQTRRMQPTHVSLGATHTPTAYLMNKSDHASNRSKWELGAGAQCFGRVTLAQLGERATEDRKVPCSIHGGDIHFMQVLQRQCVLLTLWWCCQAVHCAVKL